MSSTTQLPKPTAEAVPTRSVDEPSELAVPVFAWRLGGVLLMLLPGALTLYLAFRTGGYYPEAYASVLVLLAICLGASVIISRQPFAGLSIPLLVAGGALALLVIWTWFSSGWSDAPQRALFESERTALYLVALLVFGVFLRRRGGLALAVTGVAAAILGVCAAAVATRLYPDVFTVSTTLSPHRLSFPISYWNSLGLFAAIGLVLLLHLASDLRTNVAIRAIAAAGVPVTATTIYFTFSRGATGAVALGVVTYLLVGRSRGLIAALLATAPVTALVLREAYAADLLGTPNDTTAAAAAQGHDVAAALLLACSAAAILRLALIPLDRTLGRLRPRVAINRRAMLVGTVSLVLLGGALALAIDAPDRVQRAYDAFTKPEVGDDARTRFRSVTLSGRQDHWDVALQYYRADRLTGAGAGTFETQWLRSRSIPAEVDQAHSLYIEVLGELGLVGLGLLVVALAAILVGLFRRARGARRPVYGALFAVTLMWAAHAGVDWDWELPALGVGLFALAGIGLARATPQEGRLTRFAAGWPFRVAVALACLFLGVTAVRTVIADAALDEANNALDAGRCRSASADARTALSAVGTHPQAFEVLGWCDISAGRERAAVTAMSEAARLDPTHWRYRYDLAVARAAAGRDPRPDLREARRLNRFGAYFTVAPVTKMMKAKTPEQWKRLAASASRPGN